MASALDMVAGAGQYGFDPLGDIYEGRKTRFATNEMNRADQARPLMGQALQGDTNALNSLAGIDPQGFMDVSGFQDKRAQAGREEAAAKADRVASLLYWADTPEKWQVAVQRLQSSGYELEPQEMDFNNRGAMLAEHMSIKEQMTAAGKGGDGPKYGMNPVWTQDPVTHEWHLYQSDQAGGDPHEMDFGGNIPQPTQTYLNQGDQFLQAPTKGALPAAPATVPINNAAKAAATEVGKEQGTAAALHASLSSKLPGLQKVVGNLKVLADEATYTKGGQLYDTIRKETGQEPRPAAVARAKYIAMVDNQVLPMLRDTFGAQFTVVEGETLRSTLGDPNRTPEEKKAVLDSFIEQKIRNVEAAAIQGNVDTGGGDPELEDALSKYQ